jgi:hypothetical protein
MGQFRHSNLSVSGALRNWQDSSWEDVCTRENGQVMTPAEVREHLLHCQEQGRQIIPLCHERECPDYDFSGGGCPGHFRLYADEAIEFARMKGFTHLIQTGPSDWEFGGSAEVSQHFKIAWSLDSSQLKDAVGMALDANADFPELDAEASLSCKTKLP